MVWWNNGLQTGMWSGVKGFRTEPCHPAPNGLFQFSLFQYHSLSLFHSHSLSLSLYLYLPISLSIPHLYTLSLTHTHTHTLSLYLSPTNSQLSFRVNPITLETSHNNHTTSFLSISMVTLNIEPLTRALRPPSLCWKPGVSWHLCTALSAFIYLHDINSSEGLSRVTLSRSTAEGVICPPSLAHYMDIQLMLLRTATEAIFTLTRSSRVCLYSVIYMCMRLFV